MAWITRECQSINHYLHPSVHKMVALIPGLQSSSVKRRISLEWSHCEGHFSRRRVGKGKNKNKHGLCSHAVNCGTIACNSTTVTPIGNNSLGIRPWKKQAVPSVNATVYVYSLWLMYTPHGWHKFTCLPSTQCWFKVVFQFLTLHVTISAS